MPIPGGGHYAVKNGVRLHFDKSGKVNEAKNLKTGATHTPAEFKADSKKRTLLRGSHRG
jgi:hypothetical protein